MGILTFVIISFMLAIVLGLMKKYGPNVGADPQFLNIIFWVAIALWCVWVFFMIFPGAYDSLNQITLGGHRR